MENDMENYDLKCPNCNKTYTFNSFAKAIENDINTFECDECKKYYDIIDMHYAKYKNEYNNCKTLKNSYNKQTKHIKVFVERKNKYRKDNMTKYFIERENEIDQEDELLKEEDLKELFKIIFKNME